MKDNPRYELDGSGLIDMSLNALFHGDNSIEADLALCVQSVYLNIPMLPGDS